MILQHLWLTHFRNHTNSTFEFHPQVTIVLGSNGSGKSNIIEAIHLLATGRSNRADKIEQMVEWGSEVARVKGMISRSGVDSFSSTDATEFQSPKNLKVTAPSSLHHHKNITREQSSTSSLTKTNSHNENIELLATLTTGTVQNKPAPSKILEVNGVPRQLRKFTGHLRVVIFAPADMRLIEGSPSRRRGYLDNVLAQVSYEYRRSLLSYQKGLIRRNKLLKAIREGDARTEQLFFWNKLLIKEGNYLTQQRQQYLDYINTDFSQTQTGDLSRLTIHYDHSLISPDRLQHYAQAEIASANTLVGPHRDDIKVMYKVSSKEETNHKQNIQKIRHSASSLPSDEKERSPQDLTNPNVTTSNPPQDSATENTQSATADLPTQKGTLPKNIDLSTFGSRGQQRMAVLWLKLGALSYIHQQTGDRPLLLLDDIFSELDHSHRKLVIQAIQNQQTIITAADPHLVDTIQGKRIEMK